MANPISRTAYYTLAVRAKDAAKARPIGPVKSAGRHGAAKRRHPVLVFNRWIGAMGE